MAWVADYSIARPGGGTLRNAGAGGVVRYTGGAYGSAGYRGDGAVIDAGEWADLTANGLAVGLVLEYNADWILSGYQSGYDLAQAARAREDSIGIPRGVTFAACDFDIQPGQYGRAYNTLHGMADAYGGWQYVGVYGSKAFCEWVAASSPITALWSTQAWSWISGVGFQPARGAGIYQHATWPSNVPNVPGCDYNELLGNWAPRTTPLQEDDLTPQQDQLLKTIGGAIMQLAGVVSTIQQQQIQFMNMAMLGDANHDGVVDHYGLAQVQADLKAIEVAVKAVSPGGTPPNMQPVLDKVQAIGEQLSTLKLGVTA